MTLQPGTRLGPYEIVGPLGAGGMGEVYRAHDARLGRDVAIKALPAAFAGDPERLARFEREAKLLASLSHPNIAAIYGIEDVGGARYLALEFVEGESLAARLARGALPLQEALEVAAQIAAGIEAAHENDVIHRDLKPGNVMLTPAGAVKVLDLGLAKSGAGDRGSDTSLSASPTMTYAATQAGVILGTAAYMSPEQARGKAVDKRTDLWSFGCVLYECLTGRQAFAGETVSDIVARILQTEPEWAALPATTPERVRALLGRCLEKDAKKRLRDIGDARIEIEDVLAARKSATHAARVAKASRSGAPPWAAIVVTAVAAAAGAFFGPRLFTRPAPPPAARFEIAAPRGHFLGDGSGVAISPDGRMLAMVAADSSNATSLWIRPLGELTPHRLSGTDGVRQIFWSPDSRSIGFLANDQTLSKITVDGGTPERIADTKAARGGAWGRDGTILFAPYSNGGIFRLPASGGAPVQVTHPDSAHGVTGHRFPTFLPDGRHFLFVTVPPGTDGKGGLCVGSLDGGPTREIGRVESGVTWVDPGWVLTTRNASLVAYRFDTGALKLAGDPVVIGDFVIGSQYVGAELMSASRGGTLVYITRQDIPARAIWYDPAQRKGIGATPIAPGLYSNVSLAPDDRRAVASEQTDPTRADLVLLDLERGVKSRLAQAPENADNGGNWSKDGTRIAYMDDAGQTLHVRSLTDGSVQTLLPNDHAFKRVCDWTPDGRALLMARLDPATKWDMWLLPLDGGELKAVLHGPANEENGQLSPDGRWLKYTTDESGVVETCVLPFMTPGLKYQVTIGGGFGFFSHDGKRFLFGGAKAPTVVHVADIRTDPTFSLGPAKLFGYAPDDAVTLDLAHDDRRLLVFAPIEKPPPQTATVLQNWSAAIRKP